MPEILNGVHRWFLWNVWSGWW